MLKLVFMILVLVARVSSYSFQVDFVPVIVDSGPSFLTFLPGDKMILSCVVKAYPTPVAKIVKLTDDSNDTGDDDQWRLLDQELDFYSNVVGDSVIEVTLSQIASLSDSGWYRCKTENVNGHAHADTFVEVIPSKSAEKYHNDEMKEWINEEWATDDPEEWGTDEWGTEEGKAEEWVTEWFTKWVTEPTLEVDLTEEWITDEWAATEETATEEWATEEEATEEWATEATENWITEDVTIDDEWGSDEASTKEWGTEYKGGFEKGRWGKERYYEQRKQKQRMPMKYKGTGWMWDN